MIANNMFQEIAEDINRRLKQTQNYNNGAIAEAQMASINLLALDIARTLAKHNSDFDKPKFLRACGVFV